MTKGLDAETTPARAKRLRRGLGPFSGGQLTAIIIAVVLAVGFPIGASATLRFANVAITDPHGSYRAVVTKSGQLLVNQADPVNKTRTRVTDDGQLRVTAAPAHQYNNVSFNGGDVFVSPAEATTELFSTVTAQRFSITSLTFTNQPGGSAAQVRLVHYRSSTSTGDCVTLSGATFSVGERMRFDVPANQTVHLDFPSPLTWSVFLIDGRKSCFDLELLSGGSSGVNVMANGFINN